jgi:hypothetical protein
MTVSAQFLYFFLAVLKVAIKQLLGGMLKLLDAAGI